nr:hypothetical protein [Tanacetum cinerariifolium]
MLAIPDEHLLKFYASKDAKSLWEAINRFGGNKESKKMQKTILKQNYDNFIASSQEELDKTYDRFQKLISQLEIHGEVISQEDANLKLLRSLPSTCNNIALIMRNKSDLDTLSMDDFYNNLKVYESEIKGQSSSSLNSQNVAFVTSDNSRSTNETINTAHSVSAASSNDQASTVSYADNVMFSFFTNQSNAPQLDNEDLKQIDTDDLEEMDLKWQVTMLTMRVKRAPRNQGNKNKDTPRRNAPEDTSTTNPLVVQDGIGYQMILESLEARIVVHEKNEVVYEEDIAFLKYDVQLKDISIKDLKNQLENALKEKDDLKLKLEKLETSFKNLTKLKNRQISAKEKTGLGYDGQMNESDLNESKVLDNVFHSAFDSHESDGDDNQVNHRFKKGEGYQAVPPPYIGNYMPPRADLSFVRLDDSVLKSKELKFNLLSVLQMCDKKNNVLFTDTEYVVLSPDFKLFDESQVLLKVPRNNNMYSFDLKNLVPLGGLTCLFEKATLDESNLWHRRLGHINFKTMNKLVRGNVVRGLPSKLFEYDQTCVACQKGKQHKASCKTKTDDTSEILKNFIIGIENQMDHNVKTIRCDNGTEFKNRIMNEFYEMKGNQNNGNVGTKANINAAQAVKKDTGIFSGVYVDEVEGAVIDFNNLEPTIVKIDLEDGSDKTLFIKKDKGDIIFQVTPKVSHLYVVNRIFRYLKGQPTLGLWYPKNSPFDLEAFSDSDYAGAHLDRKSTTRGCQFLGKRLISWQYPCLSFHITFAMSTQQDIYAIGSENRPPMINKENYVPWSSRLLWYAKSRPNGKLIHNSIINGPYVRQMIPEPGNPNLEVPVNETFHVQIDDELREKKLKQIEADDQAIQTILLGLPKDI